MRLRPGAKWTGKDDRGQVQATPRASNVRVTGRQGPRLSWASGSREERRQSADDSHDRCLAGGEAHVGFVGEA